MTDRFTSIHVPGAKNTGLRKEGRASKEEMITMAREYAEYYKNISDAILSASDEDFRIETYVGVVREKKKEILQVGRPI